MRLTLALLLPLLSILGIACAHARPPGPFDGPEPAARAARPTEAKPLPPIENPLAGVAPTASGWYDPGPLLAALRPSIRATAARDAGLQSLNELPLYDLQVAADPAAGTVDLTETAYITHREERPWEEVLFRLWGNAAAERGTGTPRLTLVKAQCEGVACDIKTESATRIVVRPATPLASGGHLRVRFELRGVLERLDPERVGLMGQTMEGFLSLLGKEGSGDYGLLAVSNGTASLANFWPVLGVRRDGKWDRSVAAAVGDVGSDDLFHVRATVDLPTGVHVATVGTTVAEGVIEQGKERKKLRRLHVAAPMVRDFTVIAGEELRETTAVSGDVIVRSHHLQRDSAAGGRALEVAREALAVFEKRFGAYPYQEFDVVQAALVGGAGGVEFSGLTTVASMLYGGEGEGLLGLLSGVLGGDAGRGMMDGTLEFVVAHEVAHQWWHVLVGSDSRQAPFADEALAQWSTMLYLEDRHGEAHAKREGDQNVRMNYQLMRMMGQPDGAVLRPVDQFRSSLSYGGLVYGKAPYFYERARKQLGDTVFFTALRRYVDSHRFRFAPGEGPLAELTSTADGAKVKALAERWLRGSFGDEDLGKADLRGLAGGMMGGGEVDAATLQQLMEQLGGKPAKTKPEKKGSPSDKPGSLEDLLDGI